jgi:hypothetical protein
MLWRSLGYYSDSGSWVPPVSFLEAQQLSKPMLDVFMKLDDILDRMREQALAKKRK